MNNSRLYRIIKPRTFIIFLLELLLNLGLTALYGQQQTISGKVTDYNNQPLPGVNVLIKGSTEGTVTNLDGDYTIQAEYGDVLIYSFIGFLSEQITIGSNTTINITLIEDIQKLDEVVVVGYGSMKKSDLTGSIASVKTEDLQKIPSSSLDQSLQGKVSGVQITQLSAQPGGATSIRIRGGSSIYAGNEPLYVVDGMPIDSRNALSWISAPEINFLSTINPSDIESIEVLKDASATSIYGARGANGVILITTKRGQKNADKISFQAYYGFQRIAKRIEVMNAAQYAELFDEAGLNAAEDDGDTYYPEYSDPESLGDGTDWQDEIYRQAPIQNYELSLSGSDEKTDYAVSINYFDQTGIIYGSDLQRYSARANIDRKVNKNIKVGTAISYSKLNANVVGTSTQGGFFPGVVNTALTMSPVLPVRDSTGSYTITDPNANAWLDNPVAVTRDVVSTSKTNRLIGNLYGDISFLKYLTLRINLGLDQNSNVQDYYNPSYTYSGSFNNGQARYANYESALIVNENTLTYNREFGLHRINLLGGFTYQKISGRSFIEITTNFPSDALSYYGISTAEDMPSVYTSFDDEALVSYLGRVNYNYNGKYLITLTGRADGSSKFGPDNKFGFFPSAAIAWRLSEEEFIQQLNLFYTLKLRTSYGISGNDKITNYQYYPTLTSTLYYFGDDVSTTGFAPERPGNDDLKWETTRQFDLGLDMGFFSGRIYIVADYYKKMTYDLLYYANIPAQSGFTQTLLNVGSIRGQGFELSINTENIRQPINWTTDFNISFNHSIVHSLKGNQATYISNDEYKLKIGNWSIIDEGEELGTFYGLISDGIWQLDEADEAEVYDAKPGDFKYIDRNNDGIINASDRTIIGHAQPDFLWSLNNNFFYKGFELSIYINGVYGNKILNANRFELESGNGLSNASVNLINRWTPENPSNEYPRANRNADYLRMSDRYLEDGTYIRLQLVSLGYNLPQKIVNKIRVQNMKVYISAKNLVTITEYTGFDPEAGRFGQTNIRQGYDYGAYPASKTFLAGININF